MRPFTLQRRSSHKLTFGEKHINPVKAAEGNLRLADIQKLGKNQSKNTKIWAKMDKFCRVTA